MTADELRTLLRAASAALDQLRLTNQNLRKGMSKALQRAQANENREAEYDLTMALAKVVDHQEPSDGQ